MELFISFYFYEGLRDQTQVSKLVWQELCPLGHQSYARIVHENNTLYSRIQKQMTPPSKYLIWQCLLGGFPGLARAVMGENTVHQEVSLPVSLYCSAFLKQVCITFVIRKSNKEKLFP